MNDDENFYVGQLVREYNRIMEAQRAHEENLRRLFLHGTVTGRIHPRIDPWVVVNPFDPYPNDLPRQPPTQREMVVDGIPSSRVNAEGVSTNTHQPMVCIKDEEECGEYCGTCSSDVQYNKDYWASREMYWNSQMHEYGVEWNPDIVF